MKNKIILLVIIIFGFFLRFYQLGDNPAGLDWDEASLGYNAYSILKTGRDEYGNFLPFSFRSFDDYKPPVYVYLTVPSVAIFGLNNFSVRFPSALLGSITVFITYFLVMELAKKYEHKEKLSLLTAFLLAISPWHLQFSRVAFEANVGLFLFITGTLFFLKGLNKGYFYILSSIFYVLSLYTYHSNRVVVPVFAMGFLLYFRQEIWKLKKWFIISLIIGFIGLIPLIKIFFFSPSGAARFGAVSVFTSSGIIDESINKINNDDKLNLPFSEIVHNRRLYFLRYSLENYLDHFNPIFWFINGDAKGEVDVSGRHRAMGMGVLYWWEAPFLLAGIYFLIKNKFNNKFIIFWWFLTAPLAAAITTGNPHAVRSLLFLPIFQIFTAYGVIRVFGGFRVFRGIKQKLLIVAITGFAIFNFIYYLDSYYLHTPWVWSQWWQYGYRQVAEYAKQNENKYDKIIVTNTYDQPHIFFLFYQKIDPAWYQTSEGSHYGYGKYEFRRIDINKDREIKNALLIGSPAEITEAGKYEVNFLDGSIAFRAVETSR